MESTHLPVAEWKTRVNIRELVMADLIALEWEGEFTHFRSLYQLAFQRALKGHAKLWIAEIEDKEVVGQVFVLLNSEGNRKIADGRKRARIHSFRVRPEYRNQGVGSNLMAYAERDLQNRKFSKVSLMVAKDNFGALRFYDRIGYESVGSDEGFWSYIDHLGQKQNVHEPSWIMRKSLKIAE